MAMQAAALYAHAKLENNFLQIRRSPFPREPGELYLPSSVLRFHC
jgi:hypothetical protein